MVIGDESLVQAQAKQKAEDLRDVGIDIDLLHMTKPGQSFSAHFYGALVDLADSSGAFPDSAASFESVMSRVRAKTHRKRALMRIPLRLHGCACYGSWPVCYRCSDLELGVGVYSLVAPASKSACARYAA